MKEKKERIVENTEDSLAPAESEAAEQLELPVCNYAPELAEHARFDREDEPCDDGRMGLRPCTESEEGCRVTGEDVSTARKAAED